MTLQPDHPAHEYRSHRCASALAREFAGIELQAVAMISLGRLEFQMLLKTQDGARGARISCLREVSRPAEARKVLVENGRASTANASSGAAQR